VLTREKLALLCAARNQVCLATPHPPAVREIAAEAGLSTGLFIRQYAALFGETPHQARIRARLERAKRLLADGATVTETCFAVGFSSLGSFSALFHRRIGASPSAYRSRFRGHDLAPGCLSLMGALGETGAGEISEKRERRPQR